MLISLTCTAWSQGTVEKLLRRGALGIILDPDNSSAVTVTTVPAGTAGQEAGIQAGDVLSAIDGVAVHSIREVQAAVGRKRAGGTLTIDIRRAGKPLQLTARLHTFPLEHMKGATVNYDQVVITDGFRLRTIESMPDNRNGAVPAVMLVQGGGCGSIDVPWFTDAGMTGLIYDIAALGYATMRVEKPGTGDSEGPPCADIGYFEELDGYRAALEKLRSTPGVDKDRIFLLGISLGGFFAPFVALENQVAGIAMYGMLASPPNHYPGRSNQFFREIATQDVQAAWAQLNTHVLAILGEYDGRASLKDNDRIAEIVNRSHPGMASSMLLPGLDHCWSRHPSLETSVDNCGKGEQTTDLRDAVIAFLKANIEKVK